MCYRVLGYRFQHLDDIFHTLAGVCHILGNGSHILACLAVIVHTGHNAFDMRRRAVHAMAQLINLMNHRGNILLVSYCHISHYLREGIHVLGDVIHILKAGFHGLLYFLVAKNIFKGIGDIFHTLYQITGGSKKFVHTAAGNTVNRAAFGYIAVTLLGGRNNADKFFAHNTVGRNRKGCSLRYFDIVIDFCDNLYLIGCHINLFNRAYLHACIAHNMPRHQSAYLRIVNAQLIAFFAKAESTHKGNNAGQHHRAA